MDIDRVAILTLCAFEHSWREWGDPIANVPVVEFSINEAITDGINNFIDRKSLWQEVVISHQLQRILRNVHQVIVFYNRCFAALLYWDLNAYFLILNRVCRAVFEALLIVEVIPCRAVCATFIWLVQACQAIGVVVWSAFYPLWSRVYWVQHWRSLGNISRSRDGIVTNFIVRKIQPLTTLAQS